MSNPCPCANLEWKPEHYQLEHHPNYIYATLERAKKVFQASGMSLQRLAQTIGKFADELRAAVEKDYELAGRPYGNSPDDMIRWFNEQISERFSDPHLNSSRLPD